MPKALTFENFFLIWPICCNVLMLGMILIIHMSLVSTLLGLILLQTYRIKEVALILQLLVVKPSHLLLTAILMLALVVLVLVLIMMMVIMIVVLF